MQTANAVLRAPKRVAKSVVADGIHIRRPQREHGAIGNHTHSGVLEQTAG